MSEQVTVTIEYPNGIADRSALVTPLGGGRYRLDLDPICWMVAGTDDELGELPRFGDTIEAHPLKSGALRFVKVVERAKLKRFDRVVSREVAESAGLAEILSKIESEGGHWERVFGGILIAYVPEVSPYDPTEDFDRLIREA